MVIDRRSFIRLFGWATPAIVLLSRPTQADVTLSERSVQAPVPDAPDVNAIVFRIDGWDCYDDVATDNQWLIRINQSWRAAWR